MTLINVLIDSILMHMIKFPNIYVVEKYLNTIW